MSDCLGMPVGNQRNNKYPKSSLPKLKLRFPKQAQDCYLRYSFAQHETPKYFSGSIKGAVLNDGYYYNSPRPKCLKTGNAIVSLPNVEYWSCHNNPYPYDYFYLDESYLSSGGKNLHNTQELKVSDKLTIKENKVSSKNVEYSSIHKQNHTNGIETVTYKKGDKVIGGYEILPSNKSFSKGIKGKLQKWGMLVATDSNGCEKPVLKNLGEIMLKIVQKM